MKKLRPIIVGVLILVVGLFSCYREQEKEGEPPIVGTDSGYVLEIQGGTVETFEAKDTTPLFTIKTATAATTPTIKFTKPIGEDKTTFGYYSTGDSILIIGGDLLSHTTIGGTPTRTKPLISTSYGRATQ